MSHPVHDDHLAVPSLGVRAARAWIHWRLLLLIVAALSTAAAWWPAQQLVMDRSLSTMFSPDDPILPPFRQLQRTFGGDTVVLAAYELDDSVKSPEPGDTLSPEQIAALNELAALKTRFEEVRGVRAVLTMLDTPAERDILTADAQQLLTAFSDLFISQDGKTLGLLVFLQPGLPTVDSPTAAPDTLTRAETVAALREAVADFPRKVYLAGEPIIVEDGFAYVSIDGQRLAWLTTLLLSIVILVTFRSLRWTVIPLVIVQAALIGTQAALVLGGFQLTMVSSMLAAIVTVVGVATVVHITIAYREERDAGRAPQSALLATLVRLASPVFWSLGTTVIGFAALMISDVGPVRSFGLMMALGTIITGIAVVFWLPGLALTGRFDRDPHHTWGGPGLSRMLVRLVESLDRRPWSWGIVSLLIIGVCAAGYPRLTVETDFTKNFRAETPVVQAYNFVESRLGGAGVWDIVIPVPGDELTRDFLDQVRAFQETLRTEVPGVTKVSSLADALDAAVAHQLASAPGGIAGAIKRRTIRMLSPSGLLALVRAQSRPLADSFIGTDPEDGRTYYRIMLRSREQRSTAEKQATIADVRQLTQKAFPEADISGFHVLLAKLIDSLLKDQLWSLLVAAIGIGLAMIIALRSIRLALVALVPNTLPIFVALGLLGHLGLKINMGTVMIAAVSLGLSIDSSIHYLIRFRRGLDAGLNRDAALRATHLSVGRSILISTLALIVGFVVLMISDFVPTIYFGGLIAAAMFGGLLGNLVLLPLLVKLVWPRDPRSAAVPQTVVGETTALETVDVNRD